MTIIRPSFLPVRLLHACAISSVLLAPVAANAVEYDAEELGAIAMAKLHDFKNRASELTMHAMGLIGIRYRYGGNAPESGLDCSGLVRYVFREVWGTQLPRTSEEISRVGQHIDKQDLQPGDLVFYNTLKRGFSHVGIYLGDNKFLHAPSSGGKVRVENMEVGYWKKRFDGARRILRPEEK